MDMNKIISKYYIYEEGSNIIINCFDFDYDICEYLTSIYTVSKNATEELLNQYYKNNNKYDFILGFMSYFMETKDEDTKTPEEFERKYKTNFEIEFFDPNSIETFLNRNNK